MNFAIFFLRFNFINLNHDFFFRFTFFNLNLIAIANLALVPVLIFKIESLFVIIKDYQVFKLEVSDVVISCMVNLTDLGSAVSFYVSTLSTLTSTLLTPTLLSPSTSLWY